MSKKIYSKVPHSTITLRPLSSLTFDSSNPRIPLSRRSEGKQAIVNYMIENENLVDLVASIGEQGFFPGEPLLVVPDSNNEGMYEVVEGNRRLAALFLLREPSLATVKPGTIKALVDESLHQPDEIYTLAFDAREEILDYLGYRHITGVDDWDSLQKARYLKQLAERHQSTFTDINDLYRHLAKLIGSKSDYVKKLLFGFELYTGIETNDFFNIPGLDEESFSFSLLTTATSYTNIREFVGIDESSPEGEYNETHLRELVDWMFRPNSENLTRVPESRSLKTLNSVVANSTALTAFRDGRTLEEAGLLTDEPRENFFKLVSQAYQRLQLAQDSIHHIPEFHDSDIRLCEDVRNLSRTIYSAVLHSTED